MFKMNILYLHETSEISGAENSLLNLIRKIDRDTFSPFFVLPNDGPLPLALKELEVSVFFRVFPKIRAAAGVLKTISVIRAIIREMNIQLVHSNSIRTHIYGAIAAKLESIPVIWHERNLLTQERIDPDRLFSFLPDRIICNSLAIAQRFLIWGRLPPKVRVIYNGVDTALFNPSVAGEKVKKEFAITDEECVIGIASRFNKLKGHETFLKAAQILSVGSDVKRRLRFLVVGGAVFNEDIPREAYLHKLTRELAIDDKVVFTGVRKDMAEVFAAMDIVVLASDAEPCGRVILEAMASGKPVIATNSGGSPEMIMDGVTGYLFSPGDEAALAEKIIALVNNAHKAKDMGEQAYKRVEGFFTIEKNVLEIKKAYLELGRRKR